MFWRPWGKKHPIPHFSIPPMGVPNWIDPTWCLLREDNTKSRSSSCDPSKQQENPDTCEDDRRRDVCLALRAWKMCLCKWVSWCLSLSRWNGWSMLQGISIFWPIPVWTMNDSMLATGVPKHRGAQNVFPTAKDHDSLGFQDPQFLKAIFWSPFSILQRWSMVFSMIVLVSSFSLSFWGLQERN